MAPPLPPKPKLGPLVRRSLFVAALGAAGCGPGRQPPRIGPPPRIGAAIDPYYDEAELADAATMPDEPTTPMVAPADAGAGATPAVTPGDAGVDENPILPDPKPPVRIGMYEPIRIGAEEVEPSTRIRGLIVDGEGRPLAHTPVRVDVGGATRIVSTDAGGVLVLDGLVPGAHDVVLAVTGFAAVEARAIASRTPELARIVVGE